MRRTATVVAAAAFALGALGAACGGDGDGGETAGDGGASDGAAVFESAGCGGCHTFEAAGSSGTTGPNLDELDVSVEGAEDQIRNGGGGMPAFEDKLSDAEIQAVAEYVVENRSG